MRLSSAAGLAPSRVRQIAALADERPGTLRLFYGEDTEPTPEFIKAAARSALARNLTYYTPNAGYPELRAAIADQVMKLHGARVDPDREVVVTASGMMAIHLACQSVLGPGTSAVVLAPVWPNIPAAVRATGARAIEVPGTAARGFEPDWDRVRDAIQPDTRMIALASPNNPTGHVLSEADWERLVRLCERNDLWLLADGVYERLVFDGPVATSPLRLAEARPRLIVAQSFSKTYRMTGWRVGHAIAPPELATAFRTLQEFVVSHAFGVAQDAARVAIREGEPFVAESRERYARNLRIAHEALNALPGANVHEPGGAFYLFPRFEGLTDSLAFCERLVREHRVGVAPGSAFGAGGEGHVRVCFAVDEGTLTEGLGRLAAGWQAERARFSPMP